MLLSLSEFPRRVRRCPRGLALNLSCLWQASNLAPKRRTVANGIFLAIPAPEVRLGQFYRLHAWPRRNHRNQFRRGRSRWCGDSLSPFFPVTRVGGGKGSVPI